MKLEMREPNGQWVMLDLNRPMTGEQAVEDVEIIGLPLDTLEYYLRLARAEADLPHQLVRAMAEEMAASEAVVLGRMGVDLSKPTEEVVTSHGEQ